MTTTPVNGCPVDDRRLLEAVTKIVGMFMQSVDDGPHTRVKFYVEAVAELRRLF